MDEIRKGDKELREIVNKLKQGDITAIEGKIEYINSIAMLLMYYNGDYNDEIVEDMGNIIEISNILYNNTSRNMLPLEDGVYDLLLETYRKYVPDYKIGAEPILFQESEEKISNQPINPIEKVDIDKINEGLYPEIYFNRKLQRKDLMINPIYVEKEYISKRIVETEHMYPELVGTLDKCKFVLNNDAINKGVFDKENVKIFERDFIQEHIKNGILDPNRRFRMIAELKYDGVSVEAEVSDEVISARTRGDTDQNLAADLTPIFKGYRFPYAEGIIPKDNIIGMKFEAIMTYDNLKRYSELRGKEYANCRTAITSIVGSSDAPMFRELIKLVPLATSLKEDRITEVEFMNKYYYSGERLRYAILEGNYLEILFQVKAFVDEAEYMRPAMPFMYDGVVISYLDEDIKEKLGRRNSINKYSIAIKFGALKKETTFRGYSYTIGQDGSITPMIHYDPVEFYGTIHPKSSGHSYKRFVELGLREGDIITVEYVDDVMPYVTKPINSANMANQNPVVEFIKECPSCGTPLVVSDSGKSIKCPNMACYERNIKRLSSMLQKLNVKDFSEESIRALQRYSLKDLCEITEDEARILGEYNAFKFVEAMKDLKAKPIYDYRVVGALGFTGLAAESWKLIFSQFSLVDIITMTKEDLIESILNAKIKGIGKITLETIYNEYDFFIGDLRYILNNFNVQMSRGAQLGKSVRFTGVRDKDLMLRLIDMGLDASDTAGVTKSTDILIIPYDGFTSSKTNKVGPNTLIVPINEFKNNIEMYV